MDILYILECLISFGLCYNYYSDSYGNKYERGNHDDKKERDSITRRC